VCCLRDQISREQFWLSGGRYAVLIEFKGTFDDILYERVFSSQTSYPSYDGHVEVFNGLEIISHPKAIQDQPQRLDMSTTECFE